MDNTNWEKEYRERFSADYAEWNIDETTDGAVDFIRQLLHSQKEEILREIFETLHELPITQEDDYRRGAWYIGNQDREVIHQVAKKHGISLLYDTKETI